MEKICLVEAGNFLLGIDASVIISTRDAGSFMPGEQESPDSLLHLESFFTRQPFAALKSGAIVLEIKKETGSPALLVDRMIGEIDLPGRFEPLPLIYPELAAQCCPQIFTHDNQIVLVLDVEKIESVREKLQTAHGIVSLESLYDTEADVEVEDITPAFEDVEDVTPALADVADATPAFEDVEDVAPALEDVGDIAPALEDVEDITPALADVEDVTPALEDVAATDPETISEVPDETVSGNNVDLIDEEVSSFSTPAAEHLPDNPADDTVQMEVDETASVPEETLPPATSDEGSAETNATQPMAQIDAKTFSKLVCWTIETYLEGGSNKEIILNADELPVGLIQQQGISDEILQALINKTIGKCKKMNVEALQILVKKNM